MKKQYFLDVCACLLFPLANLGAYFLTAQGAVATCSGSLLGCLLLAAFCEELFFRGLLLRECVERHWLSPGKAVLTVSLVFALLHLLNATTFPQDWLQVGFAFAASLVLSLIYLRYGRLWPCVLTHILVNLSSVLVQGNASTEYFGIYCMAMCLGVAYAAPGLRSYGR